LIGGRFLDNYYNQSYHPFLNWYNTRRHNTEDGGSKDLWNVSILQY